MAPSSLSRKHDTFFHTNTPADRFLIRQRGAVTRVSQKVASSQPRMPKWCHAALLILSYLLICLPALDRRSISFILDASCKLIFFFFFGSVAKAALVLVLMAEDKNQSPLIETLIVIMQPKENSISKIPGCKDHSQFLPGSLVLFVMQHHIVHWAPLHQKITPDQGN